MKVQFLNNIPLDVISGGNIYNKTIIDGLKQKGVEIDYNTTPLNKEYDVCIVDSLCMDEINPNILENNKQIIALIHQIPKLRNSILSFYRTNAKFIVTGEPTMLKLMNLWQLDKKSSCVIRPSVLDSWKPKTEFRDKPKRIVIVSNFVKNKGFEMLIRMLKRFSHLDLKYHIVGNNKLDKAYASGIIESIKKVNSEVKFYFNLSRDQVYNQLVNSDIFLSLSKSETFGMSLFEALSMGLPCLAYKTGDFNYFGYYPNYVAFNDYSEDSFIKTIEKWVSNSEVYKTYCNPSPKNKRNWDNVVNEFLMCLQKSTIAC